MKHLAWALVGACMLLFALPGRAWATTCIMTAWSGADGPFSVVTENGYSVDQAAGAPGSYAGFMYFQTPSGCTLAAGSPLYVEVDYLDLGGQSADGGAMGSGSDSGNIAIQYDALATLGNAYQSAVFVLDAAVLNTGTLKTAVSRLDNPSFNLDENGGSDMRLSQDGAFQFNIVQVRVSDQPTPLYLSDTAFLGPYTGPVYAGGTAVDSTTLTGKLICGYQGWYGAPGDTDNIGWSHWSTQQFSLTNTTLQIDPWPDMTEFTAAEQFPVPGYTYPAGGPAQLFSSDEARTILRHFQWMEAWDLDGVAVQRFVVGLPTLDRVLTNVRLAANETGRVYYVEYDMSGMTEANIVPTMTADWKYLVDTLKITEDSRYLHHGGLPVVGIFGFYPSRFSSATANAILDIFGTAGAYQAFVQGAGDWTWRTSWASDWITMLYRMGAWQPWNTGNATGSTPDYASTGYWSADQTQLAAQKVMYVPQLYPGTSSVNRDGTPPGSGLPRLQGAVLWKQLAAAYELQAASTFLGMFDEVSEGTQIVKVTNTPPTQAPNTVTYEGMPSDAYLCFTSQGSKMLKGAIPYSTTVPGCPAMTQPTIPDPIAPLDGAMVAGPNVAYSWTAALALAGGGSLTTYQMWLDGVVTEPTPALSLTSTLSTAPGTHVWRVRAMNSLGNAGGWSVAQTFTVTGAAADGGVGGTDAGEDGAGEGGASIDGSTNATVPAADGGEGARGSAAASPGGCSCSLRSNHGAPGAAFGWMSIALSAIARRRSRSRSQ